MTQDSTRRGPRPEDPLRALTRATLAANQRPGGPDCPDAEVIAAFYDGAIGAAERPVVEAHLSVCARCQSEVAAIARADEGERAAAAGDRAQGVRWWKWLTPIAAGAVAYGLWLAVQPTSTGSPVEFPRTSPLASAPVSEVARENRSPTLAAKTAAVEGTPGSEATGASPATPPVPSRAQPPQKFELNAREAEGDLLAFRRVEARPGVAKADEMAPVPSPAPVTRQDSREVASATPARAAAAAPPRLRDQPSENAVGAQASAREASVAVSATDAMSKAGASQWRVERDGSLSELTADGKTWQRASTSTRVRLTGVSAPGHGVAWAVGASGTVIRTIDGRRWDVVQAPTTADLRAVEASDATAAVVTDVDGRRYRTTDGGITWQLLPEPG